MLIFFFLFISVVHEEITRFLSFLWKAKQVNGIVWNGRPTRWWWLWLCRRTTVAVFCSVQIKILHNTLLTLISGILVLGWLTGLTSSFPHSDEVFSSKVNAIVIRVFLFILWMAFYFLFMNTYFDQKRLISFFKGKRNLELLTGRMYM